MMATFAKPENALKRAEELINVGQKQAALQALHDVITSKRYRAWQKPLERIMFKYVELCVDLRKGRFAKDGLIQYRIVCQQVNVSSLEEVIKHFMHLSTERAEQARSQSQALEDALDVDDLEADKRPEDLMMSYVSGEKGKDRSDRELVTPWFKFLWETYRTVLEILRNNSKLEALYAMTAHRAFQFCKQYKRTTEFRRLCEIIRNHLSNLNKYKDQRDRPDLSAPESLQLYLDTRFEQLKIATELYLWQEAFRSVEDIYGLMSMVKQTPKSSSLVVYYAKLTEIFWVSDSHLYHAYAWLKLFVLQKTHNKKLKQEALQLIASSVLLSALSVSPFDNSCRASHMELENEKERNLRMASLIGFNFDQKRSGREVLSRSSLLAEVVSEGVMRCVPQEVKDLYHLLEQEVLPSELESKVQPLLTKISSIGGRLASASSVPEVHLAKYVPALEKLATLRVLQQVSKVYQTMKIEVLSRLIPFFEFSQVEKIAVDAAKHNFLGMKVDHHEGGVFFENMDLESDNLQHHLAILAANLNKGRNLIIAHLKKDSKVVDSIPDLAEIVDKEHKRLLARKSIIEKRKEEQERQMLEMEHKQESLRIEHQKILEEAEKKRLESESNKRKQLRIQLEIEERELEEAQALLLEAERRSKKKGKKPILDGEKVTRQTLIDMALNEQLKERQEMEKKLQKLAKTLDYMERAKREEEAPLVEAAYQQRIVEGKYVHEQEQLNEIELSRQHHTGDLQQKYRLSRMVDNKTMFAQRILSQREAEYRRLRQESEERIQQIRDEQKRDRIARRKLLFYLKSEEDRLTRLREEEEARKHEESERKKKEEAEKKAYLDKVAEKQRQREKELEEKELQRREMLLGKSADTRPTEPTNAAPPTEPLAAPAIPAAQAAPAIPAAQAAPAGPAAPAPSTGKYVPRFRKQGVDNAPAAPPPAEPDRWGRHGDRPPQDGRWRSSNTSRSSSSWSSARRP